MLWDPSHDDEEPIDDKEEPIEINPWPEIESMTLGVVLNTNVA